LRGAPLPIAIYIDRVRQSKKTRLALFQQLFAVWTHASASWNQKYERIIVLNHNPFDGAP
jgi:hypothetical protein